MMWHRCKDGWRHDWDQWRSAFGADSNPKFFIRRCKVCAYPQRMYRG